MAALVKKFSELFFKVRGQEMLGGWSAGGTMLLKAILFIWRDLMRKIRRQ